MRTIITGTNVGKVRENNQDRYSILFANKELSIAVLCDGMGGRKGGEHAADLTVRFAEEKIKQTISPAFVENISETSVKNLFDAIITGANVQVWDFSQTDTSLDGMGTTIVLALLHGEALYLAWVGDSRAYVVNEEEESQLTTDHTVVQHMVDKGEITPEEASVHPKKHLITRAIGVQDTISFDFQVAQLEPSDIVLLCSDGLYDYLPVGAMFKLLHKALKNRSTDELIDHANKKGGKDNITAVLIGSEACYG